MSTEDALRTIIQTPIAVKQITVGGYEINYATAGSGKPLLLIHGANFGWGVWYPNMAELAKSHTVYAIDLPGAGRSTRINYAKLEPEQDFVKVTEDFICSLGLTRIDVMGFSMGGWVAMQLALRHPTLVDKLVVVNSVGFADYIGFSDRIIGFEPWAQIVSKIFINPAKRKNVEKFLREIFYNEHLDLLPEFIDYFWETMRTSHNLLFISRLTALHKKLTLEKELSKIQQSTLVIWGKQDKIIPLGKNIDNFKLIPNVHVHILENAGHVPSLEKPEEFNRLALDFL